MFCNGSINQSIDRSIDQSINQSIGSPGSMLAPSWEALGSFLGSWGGYGGQKIDPRWLLGPKNRSKMALGGVLEGSWGHLGAILAPRANKTPTSWSFGPPGPSKLEAKTEQKSIQNGVKIHLIFSLLLRSIFHRFWSRFCIDFEVDFW